ncbi:MAG: IclR family transcriptional regulator domain-containing protein, partial [Coraliomargarita sp.]
KAELAGIRKCGFGTDLEEFGDGIICFAAPIFDFSGALVGTIGLSVLTLYYTPDELNEQLGAKVCAAARAISANLGFKESSNNEI